jgi:FlaA1/EpsC-like NDP-sugar epimerase
MITGLDARVEQYLLGRPLRATLPEAVRDAFAGTRVLVTGAGGSVGAELARQLAACGPAELVLLDHAEYQLFRVTRAIETEYPNISVAAALADVSRPEDVTTAFQMHRPHSVFHAAAYKHVTIAEQCVVPATRTNVLGAVYAARAARDVDARFLLVSTDKASQPHSVMGATKRLAELCILGAEPSADAIAVRFGNVLGSSGSVVEILMEAARAGQPLTVTHPDATRFFMTAAEAVSLVLKAATMARPGNIFWLDMGRPLKLSDLVERILDATATSEAGRPPVTFIGLRAGEKLHEELSNRDLAMEPTDDPAVWRAKQPPADSVAQLLDPLRRACAVADASAVLSILSRGVADYRPSEQAIASAARTRSLLQPSIRRPARARVAALRADRRYA